MKKLIFLISLFVVLFSVESKSQTALGRGANVLVENSTYGYLWGTTADSLYASTTLTATLRIKNDNLQTIKMGLYVTKISGTVTADFIIAGSMDKVTYVNIDTIAISNVSTGMSADYANLTSWNYPYMKITATASATAQRSWFKLYFISRKQ